MGNLDMRKATQSQLREIAYNDDEAHWIYKAAAMAELMRLDNPQRYGHHQIKIRAVYK